MESASQAKNVQKLTLYVLAWPIFIEILLHMMMGNVNTWMLGFISDEAVASVGVANQVIMSAIVMFGFVATGSAVLVAQYLGANQREASERVARTAIGLNAMFGLLIGWIAFQYGEALLRWMDIPAELIPDAVLFIQIAGGLVFTEAVMVTMSSVARAHGYTKQMMWVTVGMNVLNVILNYAVLFEPFGLPNYGVEGVAIATVIARFAGMIGVWILLVYLVRQPLKGKDFFYFPKQDVRQLLRIGIPSAGEQMSYQTSQLYVMYFVTMLGAQALAAKIYAQNISFFILLFSISIASATQILIGHLVGANRMEDAYQRGLRSLWQSIGVSFVAAVLVWWFSPSLFGWFTQDESIIQIGQMVMLVTVLLEPGRCFNLVLIGALRAAGDTKFPVVMGILSMWGVSVPLAYWFGVHLDYGLPGVFVAFAVDEWFRGLFMYWRWRSRVWESKSFVQHWSGKQGVSLES